MMGMNVILVMANPLHKNIRYTRSIGMGYKPVFTRQHTQYRALGRSSLTTWFDTFMPTLDFSQPDVVEKMTNSALYWVKYELDERRCD
jgi:glycosidase